jgi:hypothetical protein
MDERIEKLALAVKAWFPDGYPSAEGDNEYWENLVIFEKDQLEKFVELIVLDCEKLLRKEGERAKIQAFTGSTYKFAYMNEAANIVKRHFGVEK